MCLLPRGTRGDFFFFSLSLHVSCCPEFHGGLKVAAVLLFHTHAQARTVGLAVVPVWFVAAAAFACVTLPLQATFSCSMVFLRSSSHPDGSNRW